MLTTASQFSPRPRSITTHHAGAARALGAGGAAGLWQQQQTRGFRFGMWSSYLDVDFEREIRRRHRMMRHKYAEQINRRLSWDKHPFAEDARHALKRMMNNYWHSHDARPGGRFCDDAEPDKQRTPENADGVRPGQNIEDVERGAMDHLIFGNDKQQDPSNKPPLWRERRRVRRAKLVYHTLHGEPVEQEDFIIDPITNRKVAKRPTPTEAEHGIDIPVKTFKDYRSQFVHPDITSKPAQAQDSVEDALSTEELRKFGHDLVDADPGDPNAIGRSYSEADPVLDSGDHLRTNDPAGPKYTQLGESRLRDDASSVSISKSDDMHRHKSAVDDAREQFDDLKPPYEETDRYWHKPSEARDAGRQFNGNEADDIKLNEPTMDWNAPATADAKSVSYGGLEQHQTTRFNDSDGKPLGFIEESVKPEVLRNYQSSVERLEPGDFPGTTFEDLRKKYGGSKLKRYNAVRYLESDKSRGPATKEPSKRFDELDQYGAVESQERGGHPVAQEEYSQDKLGALDAEKEDDNADCRVLGELDHTNDSSPEISRMLNLGKSNYREMLDSLMKQHERISDAVDREANLAVKSAKAKTRQIGMPGRKLTGNYIRDFPEEFEKSWTQTLSSAPAEATETSNHYKFQIEGENMDGGLEGAFGTPPPAKLQPALDRHVTDKPLTEHIDPYSEEHQGLETASIGEQNDPAQPSVVKQCDASPNANEAYKGIAQEGRLAAMEESSKLSQERSSELDNGPTLYKILAYDPVMQQVNMAETTSLVPDFTSALSPADALLRLSHPAKFFPHFASLGAEGFEIASGSGDVLVFRKARPSTTKQETASADTRTENRSTATEPEYTGSPINPIDMTGRQRIMSPASANFASPTGYVAYDNLPDSATSDLPPPPPPPRIKYNINLRREEPVYSGPKYRTDGGPKKKSLAKRLLVGGVWVAGLSYGLGVISEYFTTGGIDGLGPSGF